jgi:hypothetical protein
MRRGGAERSVGEGNEEGGMATWQREADDTARDTSTY